MKQLVRIGGITIILSLLFGAANAVAAEQVVKAGVSDFRARVFDLTPADGVTAGYSVTGFETRLKTDIRQFAEPGLGEEIVVPANTADGLTTLFDGRSASASVAAAIGVMEVSYSMPSGPQHSVNVNAAGKQSISFVVKAHSLLVVDAHAYSSTSDWTGSWPVDTQVLFRFAGAAGAPANQISFGRRDANTNAFAQRDLQLSYANVGNEDVAVNLYVSTALQAIPEPATVAMLAAGLAVVGFAGRRRMKA